MVITRASHARGPEFDPRFEQNFFSRFFFVCSDGVVGYHALLTHARSRVRFSVRAKIFPSVSSSDSLVVMTSALHAEGREFNPRSEQFFLDELLWPNG